ncbi:MAG: SPOR domain-containing protein [Rickettsiales bacterium]|jgi:hypothetical protein|nr:SPOR domain-containing protein [Rickettsiales bacterium]
MARVVSKTIYAVGNVGNKLIILSLLLFSMVSCRQKKEKVNSSYRIVGKNGKVIYFDKRTPRMNEEYLAKKKDAAGTGGDKNNQLGVTEKENPTVGKKLPEKNGKILASSAYSLRSVMDGTIINKEQESNIESSAEDLGRMKSSRTIGDFDYLPRNYFSDDRQILEMKAKIKMNSGKTEIVPPVGLPPAETAKAKILSKPKNNSKLYYVQLGLFRDRNNAEELFKKFAPLVPSLKIRENTTEKGKNAYKVIAGGFSTRVDLEETMKKIQDNGHGETYTFRE